MLQRATEGTSYWIEEGGSCCDLPHSSPPHSDCDVCIVGAGLSGISVAFWLLKGGFSGKVVIVDGRGVAQGATGRNGGHIWPRAYSEFEQLCIQRIVATASELGVATHVRGSVELCRTREEMDAIPSHAGEERWDSEGLYAKIPVLKPGEFCGGVLTKQAGQMSAFEFVHAMARLVFSKPNFVFVRETVSSHTPNSDFGYSVSLSNNATLHVRSTLVIATNAWLTNLLPELAVTPTRGQVLRATISDFALDYGLSIDDSAEYLVPVGPGALVYGGMRKHAPGMDVGVTDDTSLDPNVAAHLRAGLETIFNLTGTHRLVTVTHQWTGIMGFTQDHMPFVGRLRDNLFCIGGFSGHGMPQAFLAAQGIAEEICGVSITNAIPLEWSARRNL